MKEKIEQVIDELEKSIKASKEQWERTCDAYFQGVMVANDETVKRLRQVIEDEEDNL